MSTIRIKDIRQKSEDGSGVKIRPNDDKYYTLQSERKFNQMPVTETILGGPSPKQAQIMPYSTYNGWQVSFPGDSQPAQTYNTGYVNARYPETGALDEGTAYQYGPDTQLRAPLPSDDPVNAENERLAALWAQYMQGYQGY